MTNDEVSAMADLVELAHYVRADSSSPWIDLPALVTRLPEAERVKSELNRRERKRAEASTRFIVDNARRW